MILNLKLAIRNIVKKIYIKYSKNCKYINIVNNQYSIIHIYIPYIKNNKNNILQYRHIVLAFNIIQCHHHLFLIHVLCIYYIVTYM